MKRLIPILFLLSVPLNAQKLVDNDTRATVGKISVRPPNDLKDLLINSLTKPGDKKTVHAINADALGEVPDSTWFQNRHGRQRMSVEELVRGPNTLDGPSHAAPWDVLAIKSEGITPGFRIRDARGDVYLLKFDPLKNPELSTAAEVISTKFLYAIGYNVPENYVVTFNRSQLRVPPHSVLSERQIDAVLKRVPGGPSGSFRALASKYLAGTPLGPFSYSGTRRDDPNDILPHENRRELRGLRMIAAWLNHDDSRSINTLDMLVSQGDRRHVRHYLIDFGSTLGSGTSGPQKPRAGFEYLWEPRPALMRALTFGLVDRSWIRARYVETPSIGKLEFERFKPDGWKPEYRNPAFSNATAGDIYWAAKIIMGFTNDDIRAIVHTGEFSDPAAEATLARWLIERRDKIGRYAFQRVPSIDRFTWTPDGGLKFDYLASLHGFTPEPEEFDIEWSDCGQDCRKARVSAKGTPRAARVTLRQTGDLTEIVAIERDGEGGR